MSANFLVLGTAYTNNFHAWISARVATGSASDRSRLLHVGDRLLSVNGVNVASLPREEVIRLVKASGPQLVLTVIPCNACKCLPLKAKLNIVCVFIIGPSPVLQQ